MAESAAPAPPHLFTAEGEAAIARLMRRQPLLAFDFDGTLAAIVDQPADAHVPLPLAQGLASLALRGPVAVITGRSLSDARPRLGFEPTYLIGNHGAEGLPDGLTQGLREGGEASPGLQMLRERAALHATRLRHAGVSMEDKGLSLALHYRLAARPKLALRAIQGFLSELPSDLRSFGGHCVVNVVAAQAPDKADAALALLRASGRSCLLFVGDDLNDEPVFERARPDWLTVRIGPRSGQSPSRAMFGLDSQAEMGALLERLLRALP